MELSEDFSRSSLQRVKNAVMFACQGTEYAVELVSLDLAILTRDVFSDETH